MNPPTTTFARTMFPPRIQRLAMLALLLLVAACSREKKAGPGAATVQLQATLPIDAVTCLSATPDGALVAAGSSDHTVRLWDLPGRKQKATLAGHTEAIHAVALSPDGQYVASAGRDFFVRVWDVATETPVLTHRTTSDWPAVLFGHDGKTLYQAGKDDKEIKFWDVETRRVRDTLPHARVAALGLSPDGRYLAAGGVDAKVWDLQTKKALVTIEGLRGMMRAVLLTADGKTLITDSSKVTMYGQTAHIEHWVKFWDIATGKDLKVLTGHTHPVLALALTPDGAVLAASAADGTARLWEMSTGREIAKVETNEPLVEGLVLLCDGKTMLTGAGGGRIRGDGGVQVWDISHMVAR